MTQHAMNHCECPRPRGSGGRRAPPRAAAAAKPAAGRGRSAVQIPCQTQGPARPGKWRRPRRQPVAPIDEGVRQLAAVRAPPRRHWDGGVRQ
eukprot:9499510-Alexandrium_andersonii.AAC.1